jgi:hypothetical protein
VQLDQFAFSRFARANPISAISRSLPSCRLSRPLAGLAALMRYVAAYEATGSGWPGGLQEDDEKPSALGKDWEVYLHRNIAAALDTVGAAQAA